MNVETIFKIYVLLCRGYDTNNTVKIKLHNNLRISYDARYVSGGFPLRLTHKTSFPKKSIVARNKGTNTELKSPVRKIF